MSRPDELTFTWSWSTWPDPTVQSVVTVTFVADGIEGCVMTIGDVLLPPDLVGQHARGWTLIVDQLAGVLS